MTGRSPRSAGRLREALEDLARRAPLLAWREHDPIRCPRRYRDSLDREVVALLSALLAFGRVNAFLPLLSALLDRMGPRPRRYIDSFQPGRDRGFFDGFRLRIWTGDDIRCLLANLRGLFREFRSLEEAFAASGGGHRERLSRLSRLLSRVEPGRWTGGPGPPPFYRNLVVDPSGGSAAKRWNLFLRWAVRPDDGIDLGLWRSVDPRDLVVPLDVHVGRISSLIGLRRRRTLDWKAAEEITAGLARIDPDDPLRFDFPLSHAGISAGCRGRRGPSCPACGLAKLCAAVNRSPDPADNIPWRNAER